MSDLTPAEHRLTVPRSARCYTQGGSAATEAWLLLHGYGQLATRFLRGFAPLATPSRLLVAPEGLSRFYLEAGAGKVGASWMTKEDRASEIADYLGYLDQVRRELIPPVPLTVLGFSQGVATAARYAVAAAPAPVRLVCWGGLVPEEISAGAARGHPGHARGRRAGGVGAAGRRRDPGGRLPGRRRRGGGASGSTAGTRSGRRSWRGWCSRRAGTAT